MTVGLFTKLPNFFMKDFKRVNTYDLKCKYMILKNNIFFNNTHLYFKQQAVIFTMHISDNQSTRYFVKICMIPVINLAMYKIVVKLQNDYFLSELSYLIAFNHVKTKSQ